MAVKFDDLKTCLTLFVFNIALYLTDYGLDIANYISQAEENPKWASAILMTTFTPHIVGFMHEMANGLRLCRIWWQRKLEEAANNLKLMQFRQRTEDENTLDKSQDVIKIENSNIKYQAETLLKSIESGYIVAVVKENGDNAFYRPLLIGVDKRENDENFDRNPISIDPQKYNENKKLKASLRGALSFDYRYESIFMSIKPCL